jgi:uncharacterized protein
MPLRDSALMGSPCWVDLWTSDVEGSRRFYGEVFGWEAEEPNPEFGGYFNFLRDGVPTAGAMGDMGDMPATDTWKIYLSTDDITKTVATALAAGAETMGEPMPVADLGIQVVLSDPTGAQVGVWQPGTFPGFDVVGEHGAPSWFEMHTRDHAGALAFYKKVFGWSTTTVGDTDEFRYTTVDDAVGGEGVAGVMDATAWLPPEVGSHWSTYWHVDDADVTVAKVVALGGALVVGPEDTPYGRLVTVTDPQGAVFKLRQVG